VLRLKPCQKGRKSERTGVKVMIHKTGICQRRHIPVFMNLLKIAVTIHSRNAHLRLDKLSLLLDFAHREAILNGKIRYFHRQNGCE